ncbi:hypothetical protein CEXT_125741 [Caerostris extrusa]|uniref:Uncharacterized protein n=1 Tax=Caerostris extrusa TaxID=172846 RepID=A0AAV4MAE6_CAEEX|nr:hypothetical protein CEXT_125741 [Caerostris extrusa]
MRYPIFLPLHFAVPLVDSAGDSLFGKDSVEVNDIPERKKDELADTKTDISGGGGKVRRFQSLSNFSDYPKSSGLEKEIEGFIERS